EKTPSSNLEEVFQILDSPHSQVSLAKIWLHINSIYEIWCRYTAAKWREADIPLASFTSITRN
ncbi:13150_t:CDS:1, partial [Dentiscutata heterogama]